MKLITVEATFAPANMDAAFATLTEQMPKVKAMDGCQHYALYAATSGDGIAIVQRWDTMEAFDSYRTSDTFAQMGKAIGPLMTAPPVTTIAECDTR